MDKFRFIFVLIYFFSGILIFIHKEVYLKRVAAREILASSAYVLLFALICIGLVSFSGWEMPFRYIPNYVFKMLVIAPIVEEILFRAGFHGLLRNLPTKKVVLISAFVFHFLTPLLC